MVLRVFGVGLGVYTQITWVDSSMSSPLSYDEFGHDLNIRVRVRARVRVRVRVRGLIRR